jgi:hypothetical protein
MSAAFDLFASGRILRNAAGDPNAFEMIAEDVTDRQMAEECLRTAEKLEAAARLTAGIAHNFNNLFAWAISHNPTSPNDLARLVK